MPREEWAKNTIHALFTEWGAWPWPRMVGEGIVIPGDPFPQSVLDVGCGLSLKSKFIGGHNTVRVGLDLHRPYLEAAREQNPNVSWIPVQADVAQLSELFLSNTFDLVLLLDIVEHLEKPQALKLLTDAEEIAKVAVAVETPKGFLPQDLDILGFEQHHLQTHRCGFEKEELEELGYKVFVRDYELAPVKRHSTEPVVTQCQLLNAIKEV
jgi:SAM-dependent methyltransferase